jgi:hypothetical protein
MHRRESEKANRNAIVDCLVERNGCHLEPISKSLCYSFKSDDIRFHVAILQSRDGRLLGAQALGKFTLRDAHRLPKFFQFAAHRRRLGGFSRLAAHITFMLSHGAPRNTTLEDESQVAGVQPP